MSNAEWILSHSFSSRRRSRGCFCFLRAGVSLPRTVSCRGRNGAAIDSSRNRWAAAWAPASVRSLRRGVRERFVVRAARCSARLLHKSITRLQAASGADGARWQLTWAPTRTPSGPPTSSDCCATCCAATTPPSGQCATRAPSWPSRSAWT